MTPTPATAAATSASASASASVSASESTDSAAPAALLLDNVSLSLGDGDAAVTALHEIQLSVRPGEFVAVVGPSGSGKSSLLAVSGGLQRPTSGTVHIAGTDLTALKDRARTALRRRSIGFVFQQSNLLASLTVREQLMLPVYINGRVTAEMKQRADELIEAVGLTHRADRRPHRLSGGERQRAGLARALMSSPAVLLVDEPTSALDRARSKEVVELLAGQTHARATATVMATHDTAILEYADRVVEMLDGRLV